MRARIKRARSRFIRLGAPAATIWIFGCQRSGTTFLENLFRHDLDSAVFGEFSRLTIAADRTVLASPEKIKRIVWSQNARYAVIRPLFESDRADELLNIFPRSVGVWLFRDCPHVVDSMMRKWQDRFFAISKQNESDADGAWRLEEIVDRLVGDTEREPAPIESIYARYWMHRNQIPFELGLDRDPRMIFLSYERLITDPHGSVRRILSGTGLDLSWTTFRSDADPEKLERAVKLSIDPELLSMSADLYRRLEGLSRI